MLILKFYFPLFMKIVPKRGDFITETTRNYTFIYPIFLVRISLLIMNVNSKI